MSDIHCQACNEPWDSHHLRYDAIQETGLPVEVYEGWDGRLTPLVRRNLEAIAYRFGSTIYSLKSCPCCPRGAKATPRGRRRGQLAEAAANLLGDDLDGLLSEVTDVRD